MKRSDFTFIVFFFLLFGTGYVCAQEELNTDSLKREFYHPKTNKKTALKTAHKLVRALLKQGESNDTINYYLQRSFQLTDDLDDRKGRAQSWYLQGKFLISILDYNNAMNSFIEADNIFKLEKMTKEHGLAEMQFGVLLYAQNNFSAAIDYFSSAYELLKQSKDTFNFLTCKYLLGLSFIEIHDFEEAEKTLNETMLQNKELGFLQREMESRLGLVKVYLLTGRFARAMELAEVTYAFGKGVEVEGSHQQGIKARCEVLIGKAAIGLGQIKRAQEMLELALLHARLSNTPNEHIQAAESLIDIYHKTGQYAKAMDQVTYLLALKDSLAVKDAEKIKLSLEDRQNIQEQNMKINLLMAKQDKERLIRISLIILAFLLLSLSIIWFQKFKLRKESNRKMDELLQNILPYEVAEELKATGATTPTSYSMVSVLFVDMIAFTKISERLSPGLLVAELHHCFSAYDRIIQKFGLEKIKTLGDAYMCAGGVPVANETHAFDTIYAAREMIDFMMLYNENKEDEHKIHIRVGIHSGPVVAGIVGIKKFAYDIWGDTVNIAARMEQSGEAGRINISESTYELVKDSIRCSSRGKIHAKYKGEINMYFVS